MYTEFKGKTCWLYSDYGQIIRMLNVSGNIIQATASGDEQNGRVAVLDDRGFTTLFETTGRIIRCTKR